VLQLGRLLSSLRLPLPPLFWVLGLERQLAFYHNLLLFIPLLNYLRTVQFCDLVNVIYYFKLELDLASAEFVVFVLCLSGLDHVLCDLVR